jgi:hypothetical protein
MVGRVFVEEITKQALLDIAKELIKDAHDDAREIAKYLTTLATQAAQQQTWTQRISDPVPRGQPVRFFLGGVDDEATLRAEGIIKTVYKGEKFETKHVFKTAGKRVILVETVNTGSGNWSVVFHGDVPGGGRVFNLEQKGFDTVPVGLKRNFIYIFSVA